ncbi:T-box transcription factor TBX22 [Dissostichus eleginoides]|uniref:T-box transcription factor TBX22 n=1 Tax=Dissostichus eleginoides TaxID=100907 RepID=A0AAD9FK54_DISEL|nr:T-box transcription factor TBX22 [Dissostichus eleginoides]
MQGLSSRAHAFSVEALVGKPCKRMKVSDESSSAADTGSETSTFTGLNEYPVSQMKKAGSSNPRRAEDTSCDPERQPVRSRAEEADPGVEESKPKESDLLPDREVRVELQGSELWKRFYEIGTEMIITKAGRRMFPSVRVKVRNLDPGQQYYIAMDVMPVDSKRYRYVYHSSQWMVAGNTDHSCISPRLYVHPDSPCAGETWMRQVISFDRVKLTNNEMDDKGHVDILQSMHKYKPRVHVIRHDPRMDLSQIQSLPAEGVHSFSFPETEFTTVTAYQNQQITKLKIDRNPFAKGFRDPGRNRGVLDGLLESYPWRGPLSLDFKPFTIQLQGSSGSPTSSIKTLLPLSSSSPLQPFSVSALSCHDAALHALTLPLYGKTSTASPLPSRAFSSLGVDRLRGLPPLPDLPFLSALQPKKPLQCPYCFYRYSFPLNPQLTALSRHAKLAEDTTDCLLRPSPWHPTTNHCL